MKFRRILIITGIAPALISIPVALYFLGIWIPNEPSRADYPVRGIDVSHHQGEIHWDQAAASGIRFAYIKATEGSDYEDPAFQRNWDAAAAAGVTRGAYHFYVIGTPGKIQATHFIAKVPADASALPPMIDLELSGNNRNVESIGQLQRDLSEYITILAAHYGKQPVIYADRDFKKRYLQGVPMESWWINDVIFTPPQRDGERWKFWQYSWRGKVPGITGFADMDVFSGSQREFEYFQHSSTSPVQ